MRENPIRLIHKGSSLGGRAFLYLTRRARWYLTGISSARELLFLLHRVPNHGCRFRRRNLRSSGSRSRTWRTAD